MNEMLEYLIYNPIKKYGDEHTITVFDDKLYTYGYYLETINVLEGKFLSINISNEPVILMMDDSPLCIACFLSLISVGAKPLIISPKTIDKTLRKIIENSKCRFLITDNTVNMTIDIVETHNLYIEDNITLKGLLFEKNKFEISDDIEYLTITSGSGGTPKIVMHSSREMNSAIKNYAVSTLEITYKDVLFSVPKINFTYGLANSLFFSFATGAMAIINREVPSVCMIDEIIKKYKVTYFFAVPSLYERMMKVIHTENIRCVKQFISAGECLPQLLSRNWFELTGKYIYDSVGCSETGSAYLFNGNPMEKNGSAGKPVVGYDLKLIGGNARQGQLIVYGPSNAIGYLNDNELTNDKFVKDAIYTGDWFEIDEDGFYWFLGRTDDMIKKNGHWVSLNEITNCAKTIDNICNAVTFVSNNNIVLVVDVDVDAIGNLGTDKIMKYLSLCMEHFKLPDVIKIGTVPLNLNGKVDLRRVKEKYAN